MWKKNCAEERLLGVSLTGIMDCKLTNGKSGNLENLLNTLRQTAIDTNKEWAKKLGINQSVSITCVKPSGTVSQLVDASPLVSMQDIIHFILELFVVIRKIHLQR